MTRNRNDELEQLIRAETPNLRRFFHTMVPQPEVLDLMQKTMLAFVESRHRIIGSERAYLRGIARFQALKYYESRRKTVTFDSTVHTVADVDATFSSLLDQRTRLLRALHELPFDHMVAFVSRHGDEMKLEEVAESVGVSLATVKRYIDHATAKLRSSLGDDVERAGEMYRDL